jgi:murein DD-endopeptidase MepM/ murein hydrolase activator NlpD
VPPASPVAWSHVAVRAVLTLCAFVLVVGAMAQGPAPASANDLSDRISASRSGQRYYEQAMLTQDRAIASLKRTQKSVKRDLRRAKRDLKRGRSALAKATSVLRERRARYARVSKLHDDPSLAPDPDAYAARLRGIRREVRIAERRKSTIGKRVRVMSRAVKARSARLRSVKRQRQVAIARREAAEGALAAYILQMTDLAGGRVDKKVVVGITGAASLSWPTTGRISQRYGCTGFRLNPRRGSCRHFHDGIDIVDRAGTPIRAVAPGVVAYAGWNPWDERGRAWIIVLVHQDGFVSRYGHMTPTDRVRAGELVHTGQVIGRMGNTGRSTGTHLHYELLVNGRDVDPMAYLPAGVIKVDKASTKAGQRALKAKQKARQKAKQRAREKARQKERAEAAALEQALESAATDACEPVELPAEAEDLYGFAVVADAAAAGCAVEPASVAPSGPSEAMPADAPAATDPAVPSGGAGSPGVPLPRLGTSPVPA